MNRSLVVPFLAVLLLVPLSASAQFGMFGGEKKDNAQEGDKPKEGEKGDKKTAGEEQAAPVVPDMLADQDQLVKQYVDANKSVLSANAKMADALGLKAQAAAARAAADALKEGATKGNLSDADKTVSTLSAEIEAAFKTAPQMDKAAKATFSDGLVSLGTGIVKYVSMKDSVASFASGLSKASFTMAPRLVTGGYIVASLPNNLKTLTASLQNATSFAKAHDIAVPKDATKALSGVE